MAFTQLPLQCQILFPLDFDWLDNGLLERFFCISEIEVLHHLALCWLHQILFFHFWKLLLLLDSEHVLDLLICWGDFWLDRFVKDIQVTVVGPGDEVQLVLVSKEIPVHIKRSQKLRSLLWVLLHHVVQLYDRVVHLIGQFRGCGVSAE